MKNTYLGDGAYLRTGENGIWLFTFDGYEEKNHIFFEHDTLAALYMALVQLRSGDGDERSAHRD